MSTAFCQISKANRLVVSEYEVPKVFLPTKWVIFLLHPVVRHSTFYSLFLIVWVGGSRE